MDCLQWLQPDTHTPGSEHTLECLPMSPLLYHVHHQGAASYLAPLVRLSGCHV